MTLTDRLLDLYPLLAEHERTESRARDGLLTPAEARRSHIMGVYLADRFAELPLPPNSPEWALEEKTENKAHFAMMAEALAKADGVNVDPYTYARQQHALLCQTEQEAR